MSRKSSVITQADIAKAAGVSRMTVSYAMRDSPMVSSKTREHVKRVAEELGYRPNPLISSLMRYLQSGCVNEARASISFVLAGIKESSMASNPSLRQFIEGASKQALHSGFGVELHQLGEAGLTSDRLNSILDARGTPGCILLLAHGATDQLEGFAFGKFALATYGYALREPLLHRVCSFHSDLILQAGTKLYQRGYRRIGLTIPGYLDEPRHVFLSGYHSLALSLPPDSTIEPLVQTEGVEQSLAWAWENELDALLCGSFREAQQIYQRARDWPEPLGVATLDQGGTEGVAGMTQDNPVIGSALVDLVLGQINRNQRGVPDQPKTVMIQGHWREGESALLRRR